MARNVILQSMIILYLNNLISTLQMQILWRLHWILTNDLCLSAKSVFTKMSTLVSSSGKATPESGVLAHYVQTHWHNRDVLKMQIDGCFHFTLNCFSLWLPHVRAALVLGNNQEGINLRQNGLWLAFFVGWILYFCSWRSVKKEKRGGMLSESEEISSGLPVGSAPIGVTVLPAWGCSDPRCWYCLSSIYLLNSLLCLDAFPNHPISNPVTIWSDSIF